MTPIETQDAIVEFDLRGHDRCLVTFTPWSSAPPALGFAAGYHQKLGVDAVFFRAKHNGWWEAEALESLVERLVSTLPRHRRRVAYGSSMGAFGALAFADRLGCESVLAVSPQASIDRRFVPWETRWAEEAAATTFRLGPVGRRLSPAVRSYLIFDPLYELDRRHVDMIERDAALRGAKVTRIALPLSGHPATAALQECRLLDRIVRDGLAGELEPREIERAFRGSRAASSHALFAMLTNRSVTRRHPVLVLRAARSWRAALPSRPKQFHFLCARLLLESGRPAEALSELESAAGEPGTSASNLALLRERCLAKLRR